GASLVWFFAYKPKLYVFSGEINELAAYEHLYSDKVYLRSHLITPSPDIPPVQTSEFAVVSDQPFTKGQTFQLFLSKNEQERGSLELAYDPDDKAPRFKVKDDTGKFQLVRTSDARPGKSASLLSTLAYAQEIKQQSLSDKIVAPKKASSRSLRSSAKS